MDELEVVDHSGNQEAVAQILKEVDQPDQEAERAEIQHVTLGYVMGNLSPVLEKMIHEMKARDEQVRLQTALLAQQNEVIEKQSKDMEKLAAVTMRMAEQLNDMPSSDELHGVMTWAEQVSGTLAQLQLAAAEQHKRIGKQGTKLDRLAVNTAQNHNRLKSGVRVLKNELEARQGELEDNITKHVQNVDMRMLKMDDQIRGFSERIIETGTKVGNLLKTLNDLTGGVHIANAVRQTLGLSTGTKKKPLGLR